MLAQILVLKSPHVLILGPMFVTNEAFTSVRLLSSSGASRCLGVMSKENSLVHRELTPNQRLLGIRTWSDTSPGQLLNRAPPQNRTREGPCDKLTWKTMILTGFGAGKHQTGPHLRASFL